MKKLLLPFIVVLCCLAKAKEIAHERLGYSVSFPDESVFTDPKHTALNENIDVWKSESAELGQEFTFMVIDTPMPGEKSTFEENAREWEKGMLKSFSSKVSSEFTTLSGEPALHVITTLDFQGVELYFSNWYIQKGQTTYNLAVASVELAGINNSHSKAFLNSFKLKSSEPNVAVEEPSPEPTN